MDIQEVLQWTDEQVFAKTGKYLDSLQKAILEGTWQRHKYGEIAENYHCGHDHVKKEAWKLWKILSDVLEVEDIKQSNIRSILESKAVSSIYNFVNSSRIISQVNRSHINICGETRQSAEEAKHRSPSASDPPHTPNLSPIIALTDAPELTTYYDRTSEISTLKQWILEARTRAIALYGLDLSKI